MSESSSNTEAVPDPAGEDELTRAAAAGPPLVWDDSYAEADDGRPENPPNDLLFNIFREPEEMREERGQ
jgi:hypothetical protein